MIRRLWGKCNGAEVIFTQDKQGRWTAAVPASEDKTYIIEVWGEDEAGNESYFATIKTMLSAKTLDYHFEVIEVGSKFTLEEVRVTFSGKEI